MTLTLPAEWEPHERCLMGWPGQDRVSTRLLTAVKVDYALVAKAIAAFEPVTMLARPGFGSEASAYCGSDVEVVELAEMHAWLRDTAPLFVRDSCGKIVAIDFRFNQWGSKSPQPQPPVGSLLAEHVKVARRAVPLVLEGGAITVDGQGTLIAVKSTVLNATRNPLTAQSAVEDTFREALGIERTIWLEHGLLEDQTGGHVDNVAAFISPGRVLCQTVSDPDDPNHAGLAANCSVLNAAIDARGRRLEVIELDLLPYREWAGRRIALPYLNAYIGNGCVIVPLACLDCDEQALQRLREVFGDRQVVGVPATNLARRGGGVHCITQQLPRRVRVGVS